MVAQVIPRTFRGQPRRRSQHPVLQSERLTLGRQLELAQQRLQCERTHRCRKLAIMVLSLAMPGGFAAAHGLPQPPAEHFADLFQRFGKCDEFSVIDSFDLPGNLDE